MSKEDDLNASVAHIVLCCISGQKLANSRRTLTQPGVHANFFIHGLVGVLHFQSGRFNNDFSHAYRISRAASRCLALPCLMADLYSSDRNISTLFFLSGAVPFVLMLSGNDHESLTNLVLASNIVALCVYSQQRGNTWGWYTAGAALLAYFCAPASGSHISYPLFLSLFDYCTWNLFTVTMNL